MEFLLGHGFRMDAPYLEGVPYFSRKEEAESRAAEVAKRDRNNFADIFIRDGDSESLKFIQRVRREITAWRDRNTVSTLLYQQSQEFLTDVSYSRSLPTLTSGQSTWPRQAIMAGALMDFKNA